MIPRATRFSYVHIVYRYTLCEHNNVTIYQKRHYNAMTTHKGPATRNDFVNDIVNDARADAIFATLKAIVDDIVDDIVTCGMALKVTRR